jgi:hypothetical protein
MLGSGRDARVRAESLLVLDGQQVDCPSVRQTSYMFKHAPKGARDEGEPQTIDVRVSMVAEPAPMSYAP